MALGDGNTWDETTPTDATVAVDIDDYNQDLRKGIRSRMAIEHEFPASQAATAEAGMHKFITLQQQGAKPTLAGTQKAAVYAKTDNNLYFENSGGTEITIVSGTAVGDGKVLANATDTTAGYITSKMDGASIVNLGTGTSFGLNVYTSTWFAVTPKGSYTLTHGLGSTDFMYTCLFSTDTTGGAAEVAIVDFVGDTDAAAGLHARNISDATIQIFAGSSVHTYISAGTGNALTTGFARVTMIRVG